MIGWRIVVLGVALVVLGRDAAAQADGTEPQANSMRIGIGAGFSVPAGDAGDSLRTGLVGQVFVLYELSTLTAIRIDVGYQKYGSEHRGLSERVFGAAAEFKLNLTRSPIQPYVLAGVGVFNAKTNFEVFIDPPPPARTAIGIDGGAGVAFRLGRVNAFVEGRMQHLYVAQSAIGASSIQTVPITFGIVL